MNIKVNVIMTGGKEGEQKIKMVVKIERRRTVKVASANNEATVLQGRGGDEKSPVVAAVAGGAGLSATAIAAGTRAFLAQGNAERLGRSLATAFEAMDEVRRCERTTDPRRL